MQHSNDRGFSLIELVMVILVTGVLAAAIARFVVSPVRGFLDLTRRAELTDILDTALNRMSREVQLALPNSIRTAAGGNAVEFLRTVTGVRYRAQGPGDTLNFTLATDTFDVLGGLNSPGAISVAPGAGLAECLAGTVHCLAVFNTGQSGANAYAGDVLAGLRSANATTLGFSRATPLPFASPAQRAYVLDGPVTYLCRNLPDGVAARYAGYAITASQAAVDSHAELIAAGATVNLLADHVQSCAFQYTAGTSTRSGLVTLTMGIASAGESAVLMQQIQVSNAP